jgi:two-component system CitB family sensor kinase
VRKLSTQIFVAQLAILVATILIGFVLFAHQERSQLDHQYEERAASIAQVVAGIPRIVECLDGQSGPCDGTVQQIASRTQRATGAAYVVVIDMNRVRHSHPMPRLIGKKVDEPIVTKDGHTHVGIDNGSTGRSANGKAPMYATDGRMIGEVSVGIRESSVSGALWSELPVYAGWFALALAAGTLASWVLARRLKRRTFGLELDEIAGARGDLARHPRGGRRAGQGRPDLGDERRGPPSPRTSHEPGGGRAQRGCSAGPAAGRPHRGRVRSGRARPDRRLLPHGQPDAGRSRGP